jgi:N-acetylmuramoyl-L-alanine amidase
MRRRWLVGVIALLLLIGLAGAVAVDNDSKRAAPRRTTSTSAATTSTSTSTTAVPPTTAPVVNAVGPGTRLVVTPTGIVAPVLSINNDGTVTVRTPCENAVAVRGVRATGPFTVVLDPGHGGSESGAVGANGLREKTLNLNVTEHIERALTTAGVATVRTRGADYRMTLTSRAQFVAAAQPKIFVSVHHNGESDGPRDGPGTEVFYQHQSGEARRLGGLIYEEVVRALSQYQGVPWQADRDAGVKTRINDRGGDYYAMLRQTAGTPAVLAELAFLSNPPEAELLARPDVQQVEGEAVARGIVRYLTTNDPGSGYTDAYPRTTPAGGGGGTAGCVDPPLQ